MLMREDGFEDSESTENHQPTISWSNLCVFVPSKDSGGGQVKNILQNVHGNAKPNRTLAIMGASGAGKSTLLSALIGRLSPKLKMTGQIKGW